MDELGAIIDQLRQVGLKGFVASTMNDPDYMLGPGGPRQGPPREDRDRTLAH